MSDPSDDANRWSWITPEGKTVLGVKAELMLALRGERLPATTLVWRTGWAEWLPASRVTELKSVLPPGAAEPAHAPKLAPGAAGAHPPAQATARGASATPRTLAKPAEPSRPPPAPVRHAKAAVSQPPPAPVRGMGGSSRPPPAPIRSRGPAANAAAAAIAAQAAHDVSILGPPREPAVIGALGRAPMPTLGGEDVPDTRTATLRPPGAVPPPPRSGFGLAASPTSARAAEEELPTQRRLPPLEANPVSDTLPDPDAAAPTVQHPGGVGSSPVAITSTRTVGVPPPAPEADFDVTLGSTPFDPSRTAETVPPSTTLESAGAPPQGGAREGFTLPIPRPVAIVLAVFTVGVLLLISGGLVFSSRSAPHAATSTSASPAAAAPAPGCRLVAPAARLAVTVERSVPPVLARLSGKRMAVGFAAAPKVAAGLVVELDTLDAVRAEDQTGDAVVRSVTPRLRGDDATFHADRADGELTGARTLAGGATVGFSGADLVRLAGTERTVVFPAAGGDKTTEPRADSSSAGALITFRRGGLGGQVFYGWLDASGKPRGALATVATPGLKFVGTPDAAAGAKEGLIAFAGKSSESSDWRVQLTRVPLQGKASSHPFETPPGGSGGGNIAPTIAALGDSGWLLQWTEGAAGAYQVRLQRLNEDLEPAGEARLVSPKGANAGQGAVLANGDRALSVFIQTTAGHDELWGASFECH